MKLTPNFFFKKADKPENYNLDIVNENLDKTDEALAYLKSETDKKTTTGEANKAMVFSDLANTIKHVFSIMKSAVNAFSIKNSSGTDVFTVDTTNNELSGSAISESAIAKKIVKRDSNGDIANIFNTGGVFFRKVLNIPPFTRVPNENFDILIPISSSFSGRVKVKLLGAWNYGNGTGVIEKTFNLSLQNAGTIDCQIASYTDIEGYLAEYVAIKNAIISNGNLKITIVKKDQTKDIVGRVILEVDTYSNDVIKNATLSAVYIGDNSIEPLPTYQSRGEELIPVGKVDYLAHNNIPIGWLKANGAAVSRTTYARLYAKIGTTFGSGDGVNTFNLPDLRGVFTRGLDDGRGLDSGRSLGSYQDDALQNITGYFDMKTHAGSYVRPNSTSGAFYPTGSAQAENYGAGGTTSTTVGLQFDASRVVKTAAETRPKNVALIAIIKY